MKKQTKTKLEKEVLSIVLSVGFQRGRMLGVKDGVREMVRTETYDIKPRVRKYIQCHPQYKTWIGSMVKFLPDDEYWVRIPKHMK